MRVRFLVPALLVIGFFSLGGAVILEFSFRYAFGSIVGASMPGRILLSLAAVAVGIIIGLLFTAGAIYLWRFIFRASEQIEDQRNATRVPSTLIGNDLDGGCLDSNVLAADPETRANQAKLRTRLRQAATVR
jgi:energy-coupling factor transporter transmembrane protein EcfT